MNSYMEDDEENVLEQQIECVRFEKVEEYLEETGHDDNGSHQD
jgi:hypothetical protein